MSLSLHLSPHIWLFCHSFSSVNYISPELDTENSFLWVSHLIHTTVSRVDRSTHSSFFLRCGEKVGIIIDFIFKGYPLQMNHLIFEGVLDNVMTTFPSKLGKKTQCLWICNLSGSSESGAESGTMFQQMFMQFQVEVVFV